MSILTFAHSSEKRHSRLFNFNGGTACLARYSLCAFKQDFSNSVKPVALVELNDWERRTRCGVLDDETGGVIEFLAIVTRFFGTSISPFCFLSATIFRSVKLFSLVSLFSLLSLFWLFWSLLSSDDDRCPFGVSDALVDWLFELDRKKRWAHGDFWASDSNISCFSFITMVRSGLWPRYVCIVSNVKNSHCGSYQ